MPAPAAQPPQPVLPPSPAASRRFTREDVLRLGRGAQPWEFVPVAVAALRAAPGDTAIRFLFAAALGRLGLRTLAIEQLGLIGGPDAEDASIGKLRGALAALPDDELSLSTRAAQLTGNLGALGERAADLMPHLAGWMERAGGVLAYRTVDGNVVRRESGQTDPAAWMHLADHAGAASRFVAQNIHGKPTPQPPLTVEGIDPPWLVAAIARATARDATGFQPRLVLLQADPMEALDGLCLTDLREDLGAERVMVFAGEDAGERLGAWARANLDKRLNGPFVPLLGVRKRVEPGAQVAVQGALQEQERAAGALKAAVHARAEARGAAHWAERFAGRAGGGLRILIPTCRYTSFLQHAGRDLAAAFERLGHRAEVLIEPDGHSQMSAVAYLSAMERLDPDVVVFINYTRAQLGDVIPASQPVVCWVQDMMPHLFTRESGAAQGPLDFIAGHCGEDLFARYGYARDRAIASPVVASESKFHSGPVDPALAERFACEIACVTHHSETVEAMHARLKRESAADPDAGAVLEALLPVCVDVAARAHDVNPWSVLRDQVRLVLARRHRMAGDPDVQGAYLRNYAVPVADRAMRHLALEWAAGLAARRGWRLRLYGRGWEAHPTLSRHAAGTTEHGEELRACFQCAAVHLHLCLTTLMHQRPMECVLSGGLPIVRPTRDALAPLQGRAQMRIAEESVVSAGVDPESGAPVYSYADTPEGMRYLSMAARLGMRVRREGIALSEARLAAMRRRRSVDPIENDPSWLFGDLPEISFADAVGLERLVERAIERPDWRRAVSGSIAARVRERLTHTALAGRVLGAIADRAGVLAAGARGDSSLPAGTTQR